MDQLLSSLERDCLVNPSSRNSRFTIWGWAQDREVLSPGVREFALEHGIDCLTWDYGRGGRLFLLNSHPDIAYSDEAVMVKLGFARSELFDPLNARDLLNQRLVSPDRVYHKAIHGNPSVLCISTLEPSFCVYQSLPATSQMYYWRDNDSMIFSDALRHLAAIATPLELNQDAVLCHLLFRTLSGNLTCFRHIVKLLSGHLIKFHAGTWSLEQAERLNDLVPEYRFHTMTREAIMYFEQQVERIVGHYVEQATQLASEPRTLLSGGVDSTLLASFIEAKLGPQCQPQSTSYTMHVPSFLPEVEYADYGRSLLKSEHTVVDVHPWDIPRLLEQLIALVAHPVGDEEGLGYLALAQFHSTQETRQLFSGEVMDALFGTNFARRLRQVKMLQSIPGAGLVLGAFGRLLEPVWHNKAYGMNEAAYLLRFLRDPLSFQNLFNTNPLTDFGIVQKCFKSDDIDKAIEHRLDLSDIYGSSQDLVERKHFMNLTHICHDDASTEVEVFNVYDLEYVTPFLDSDFIRCALTFKPRIRFYANGQTKWLARQLIEKRLGYQTAEFPKLDGGFPKELFEWMKHGVLRDMVDSIVRPGYMSVSDFEQKRNEPDWFTWNILNLDLFQKRFLNAK